MGLHVVTQYPPYQKQHQNQEHQQQHQQRLGAFDSEILFPRRFLTPLLFSYLLLLTFYYIIAFFALGYVFCQSLSYKKHHHNFEQQQLHQMRCFWFRGSVFETIYVSINLFLYLITYHLLYLFMSAFGYRLFYAL